jgi:hypothetical protein
VLAFVAGSILQSAGPGEAQTAQEKALAQIEQATGLKPVKVPGTEGAYLGKTHRGYEVIYTAKAGDVWGRYAARLTAAEVGREVGGLAAYLTGQDRDVGRTVVDSPFDRLLSRYLGEPLAVTIVLKHGKPHAPRLDVLSEHSRIGPEEAMPRRDKVGSWAGHIYADDSELAGRIAANAALMKRMKSMRSQYLRLDPDAAAFFWAGSETDYSGMIRDHGGYDKMLNALMDNLADVADAVPAGK